MTTAVRLDDVRRGREEMRAYRQQVWARREAEAATHPAESHPALRDTRRELEEFDRNRDRYERRERVQHLARIGMSDDEIAQIIGIKRKNAAYHRVSAEAPARPQLYNAELASDERVAQLEATADLALYLAMILRDEDAAVTWGALTRLDRRQLQELAVIALAAIPVDFTRDELLAWVENLPAARAEA